ncbi:hypothetical protein SDC9_114060 [bioreactor metagenome]|uniref:Uncharacterized protein n=1 Tax=bioreactor metagenome TaxID=1076179 RepID=A0A645BVA1_9ZZZZ
MVVEGAGDDVAAHPGAGQRGRHRRGQPDRLEGRVHLEGDDSGDLVVRQPQPVRLGLRQDQRQALGLAYGGERRDIVREVLDDDVDHRCR